MHKLVLDDWEITALVRALDTNQTLYKELSDGWADIEELKHKIKDQLENKKEEQ